MEYITLCKIQCCTVGSKGANKKFPIENTYNHDEGKMALQLAYQVVLMLQKYVEKPKVGR